MLMFLRLTGGTGQQLDVEFPGCDDNWALIREYLVANIYRYVHSHFTC
jgi:hypothetical protein